EPKAGRSTKDGDCPERKGVGATEKWIAQRFWKRFDVRSTVALQFATSSSMESPPNFSTTASASTNATMASPTTAAAGTAQTSLRSMVAGLSAIVVRSTERSGFISVEMGFM